MSSTYGLTNYLSSFGFTERWRKACIRRIEHVIDTDMIYDLMSGMGELWVAISQSDLKPKEINAVDISPSMNKIALRNRSKVSAKVNLLLQNILNNELDANSADVIVSSFGLKTFNSEQLTILAGEISRILKPGCFFSFVEISVPPNKMLRFFYMIYLKWLIPLIGLLFQGNSRDYRMLGVYTEKFGNCQGFHQLLIAEGLESHYEKLFFGCASITWGRKVAN